MKIVLFCHSLVSCWNHGNAHFLRGLARELVARGHRVDVHEPRDGWSRQNLRREAGDEPIREFHRRFPELASREYDLDRLDLDAALRGADLVLAHEWSEPALIARLGEHRRRRGGYVLLFHDTHHRAVTAPEQMARFDLTHFDGVLAFGAAIRDIYLRRRWARRAWTWHEAADVRLFHPLPDRPREGDLVWIGNWGDEERTRELEEFLFAPAQALGLRARIRGVRYPEEARRRLREAGIEYAGWLPNYLVPEAFARHAVTVHVPRRPYARALPGIPTIRPFEAMACGIPLICAPWPDSEKLFTPGRDYLVARDGQEMTRHLAAVLADPELARSLAEHGRRTILARHTCAHRADELLAIHAEIAAAGRPRAPGADAGDDRDDGADPAANADDGARAARAQGGTAS